ncbi:TerB family tellurite resistance protein [Synechococcales cyanobacterium C]|uniref:TerB family tellurite resistance protein n=1 Tax=Petrachloros mirabilis ULC683 TaxID=2781853 RepID=A0A8K1ZWP0_9CYAN|nr:TerB family tellurite resistance protein [Petrachloros mirabilis]NCJ05243.1 TerB family tellurite resistance protein [Petrachloros mirabilis ULC683]
MDTDYQHRLSVKILIGSAWADRHLEPAEARYLQSILERYHLDRDKELLALLSVQVPLQQTELWMVEYLRDATEPERRELLAKIGRLLIADEVVSDREHDLLDDYHELMAKIPPHPAETPSLAQTIGQFVRRAVKSIEDLAASARSLGKENLND